MKEEYPKALEVIFAYGYECCIFKHNICGDRPKVPEEMPNSADQVPPEFFVNLWCLPVQAVAEATTTEVPVNKAAKEQRLLLPRTMEDSSSSFSVLT